MIDRNTVQQIIDTADVVDVVSDFVTLRRRGANWVGLCPFHNDRTPSFYVSRNKQIYKCFSCGEAGSAVGFVMKHEQMSYPDALKYLAAKYHIEVKERELTDEERTEQTERESMLILNEWACRWMEEQLWDTQDGQEIGLSYFRDRGFTDATIRKFRLGYCPEDRTALYKAAIGQGYNRELLFKLGLCKDDQQGGGYDFYRGRVMFPIFNVAGKVIAFGGRTLKKDDHAKYFNSPDSIIYDKSSSTMYGLFQAKRAIAKQGKAFIVEGYADVISMHQAGFENVIASSGTALTDGHIHLLHRFTENVTELFDGDAAGIRAAMKGIDKLLSHGLNIKVLLLPDGDDPDSYSRKHSSSEIQHYIDEHESDFIQFKTRILLDGVANDPIKQSQAIGEVVRSIAVIPNEITRSVYAKECSRLFGVSEQMLLREIKKQIDTNKEEAYKQHEREERRRAAQEAASEPHDTPQPPQPDQAQSPHPVQQAPDLSQPTLSATYREERIVIRLIIKYGMCYLCDTEYDDGIRPTTVVEHIYNELSIDNIAFSDPTFAQIFDIALHELEAFYSALARMEQETAVRNREKCEREISEIDPVGKSVDIIENEEKRIRSKYNLLNVDEVNDFRQLYLERLLCSHADDRVREMSSRLATDRYQLSKIHTLYTHVASEFDRLANLVPAALNNWKNAIIGQRIEQVKQQLKQGNTTVDAATLLQDLQELYRVRTELAKLIGDRVVNP